MLQLAALAALTAGGAESVAPAGRHGHGHPHDQPGWRRAHLHGPNLPQAWVRWSIDVRLPAAGSYQLQARATDRAGTTQPDSVPFNTAGYQFWAVVRHPVSAVA